MRELEVLELEVLELEVMEPLLVLAHGAKKCCCNLAGGPQALEIGALKLGAVKLEALELGALELEALGSELDSGAHRPGRFGYL